MKEQISINSAEFEAATEAAVSAVENLNTKYDRWEKKGEESAALEAYAKKFYRLEQMMLRYKTLLEKDVKAIQKAGKEMKKTDDTLSDQWNKGVGGLNEG